MSTFVLFNTFYSWANSPSFSWISHFYVEKPDYVRSWWIDKSVTFYFHVQFEKYYACQISHKILIFHAVVKLQAEVTKKYKRKLFQNPSDQEFSLVRWHIPPPSTLLLLWGESAENLISALLNSKWEEENELFSFPLLPTLLQNFSLLLTITTR